MPRSGAPVALESSAARLPGFWAVVVAVGVDQAQRFALLERAGKDRRRLADGAAVAADDASVGARARELVLFRWVDRGNPSFWVSEDPPDGGGSVHILGPLCVQQRDSCTGDRADAETPRSPATGPALRSGLRGQTGRANEDIPPRSSPRFSGDGRPQRQRKRASESRTVLRRELVRRWNLLLRWCLDTPIAPGLQPSPPRRWDDHFSGRKGHLASASPP